MRIHAGSVRRYLATGNSRGAGSAAGVKIEIVKLEILKIRQENVARQLVLLGARKVIERLPSRGGQAAYFCSMRSLPFQ
jgi:hypothetical protein